MRPKPIFDLNFIVQFSLLIFCNKISFLLSLFLLLKFLKIEFSIQTILGKKDKKVFNNKFGPIFDLKKPYYLQKLKNKSKIIFHEKKPLFFYFDQSKFFPTIFFIKNHFNKEADDNFTKINDQFKVVFVNDGAIGPILRGAYVMSPGIFLYYDQSEPFKKGDIVIIKCITNNEFIAVGEAVINYENINETTKGIAVKLFHTYKDKLNQEFYIF